MEEIAHVFGEKLCAHAREARKASAEPKADADVPAARERISAELGFVTFAEGVRQAVQGKTPARHAD
jgi:hypothetical protein